MVSGSHDFSLDKYQELCEVLKKNYRVCTVFEYLSEKPEGNIAVVRHDVDRRIKNSLQMAEREHEMDIRSSYYFRYPSTFLSLIHISEPTRRTPISYAVFCL